MAKPPDSSLFREAPRGHAVDGWAVRMVRALKVDQPVQVPAEKPYASGTLYAAAARSGIKIAIRKVKGELWMSRLS